MKAQSEANWGAKGKGKREEENNCPVIRLEGPVRKRAREEGGSEVGVGMGECPEETETFFEVWV